MAAVQRPLAEVSMHVLEMPGHLIRRLQQLSTQVFTSRAKAAGFDITSVQFAALDAIESNPGIDQAGVAAVIAYDRPTIGDVIGRLVAKGLVERTVSHSDRRARVLHLTPQGKMMLSSMLPVVRSLQEEILANLSNSERDLFVSLTRKAIGQSSAGSDPG